MMSCHGDDHISASGLSKICLSSALRWSIESPPAHYERAASRIIRRLPATTVADRTPQAPEATPFDVISHHV